MQIIGPFSKDEVFEVADFKLLENFERMTHADLVHGKVIEIQMELSNYYLSYRLHC